MNDADLSQDLARRVREAADAGMPLRIRGGDTKSFLGRHSEGEDLPVAGHRGIINHEPSELVITARAGTLLSEIQACLAARGQQLPFEPPAFGDAATIGGVVASGLSGPRRPHGGSVRDCLLGIVLINGRGQILRFGGQVMKNVAGYDLSRLSAGALGTLGVLLEVSIKVLPKAAFERSVAMELDQRQALARMIQLARLPLGITAMAHDGRHLYVRACGGERAMETAEAALGGDAIADSEAFWTSVREQQHAFFSGDMPLWRICVPPATPALKLGSSFIEWGGAQRWVRSDAPPASLRAAAAAHGGHATWFRGHDGHAEVFHPLPEPLMNLHRRLKQALDPVGILNPHRMYPQF